MNQSPIGIFDSGVGGTSIWKELQQLLPSEDMIYMADSLNAPYGGKSQETIINLSKKNTEYLLSRGCKLIVVACNTATTNAIDYLRRHFDVPFIGIEPAIKPAALRSATKKVGVLATKGTLASQLFLSTSKTHAMDIEVLEQQGEGLVALIEAGKTDTDEIRRLLEIYLNPMVEAKIDHLVLGCTHYPYLIPVLEEILPPGIRIIDCGEAVARQTYRVLKESNLLNNADHKGKHLFYINSDKTVLENFLSDSSTQLQIHEKDF
ncbi:MAG: glutamate racemase [Flavobacteriaceae bacterium]